MRTVWRWGQATYRCAAVTYSAFRSVTSHDLIFTISPSSFSAHRLRATFQTAALSLILMCPYSLYTNPWLVRALLAAIWTASRILVGLV